MSEGVYVSHGGGMTFSYFKSVEKARLEYKRIRSEWNSMYEVPSLSDSKGKYFENQLRTAIVCLIHVASNDEKTRVNFQHLIPRTYIKNFGLHEGNNTIYLDAVNPKTFAKILIEHSPLLVARNKNSFYTLDLEHLLSKIESGYSKALEKIQRGEKLSVSQIFDIAIFMSSLRTRWPEENEWLALTQIKDNREFSKHIIQVLMPDAVTFMMEYNWKLFTLPNKNPNSSLTTCFSPIVSVILEKEEKARPVHHPLNPKLVMPMFIYFPLSSKVGLYLVHKNESSRLSKELLPKEKPLVVAKLLSRNNKAYTSQSTSPDLIAAFARVGNRSVVYANTFKAKNGTRAAILYSPYEAPLNNITQALPLEIDNATKNKLRSPSFKGEDLSKIIQDKKAPKPNSSKPNIQKINLTTTFDDWWKELEALNTDIRKYLNL